MTTEIILPSLIGRGGVLAPVLERPGLVPRARVPRDDLMRDLSKVLRKKDDKDKKRD